MGRCSSEVTRSSRCRIIERDSHAQRTQLAASDVAGPV